MPGEGGCGGGAPAQETEAEALIGLGREERARMEGAERGTTAAGKSARQQRECE